jgi:predicted ATPase with chaperone activity
LHIVSGVFDKIRAELEVKCDDFFWHNMLMVGSPGAGKTLLARALPGILPEMSIEESLEPVMDFQRT